MSTPGPPRCGLEKQGQGVQTGKSDTSGIPGGAEGIAVGNNGWLFQVFTLQDGGLCLWQLLLKGGLQCLSSCLVEKENKQNRQKFHRKSR